MLTKPVVPSLVLSVIAAFALPLFGAETAPQTEPAPDAAVEADDDDFSPPQIVLGTQKQPVYPPAAFNARYAGSVLVEMTVQKDGTVGDVKVIECTRPKVGFEEAAMDAVKKWKFQPGLENGEPIEVTTRIKLSFTRTGSGDRAQGQVTAGGILASPRPQTAGPAPRSSSRNPG